MKNHKPKTSGQLTPDKNFTPIPTGEGDELYPNGIFEFNISRMLDHIRVNQAQFPVKEIQVQEFRNSFSNLDRDHIDSVDVTSPVIIAEISPGRFNLIDGHHRMGKAFRMGREKVPAYALRPEQHIRFLTSFKAYQAYIEYWNSKLED